MSAYDRKGTVINIQRFTVNDGPGIRTELFLKGCPLRCIWCSNPESMKAHPEVGVYGDRCIGIQECGQCLRACKQQALLSADNKIVAIDRKKCVNCTACARACVNDTLKIFGQIMSVDEIMTLLKSEKGFFTQSGGGVTISGGDPLVQWEFVRDICQECQRYRIHTCVETELYCKREILDEIIPYVDLFITDIKHMDSEKHSAISNVGNEIILDNIRYLIDKGQKVVIRIPLVPGYNDSDDNIDATGRFIAEELGNRIVQLQILPYRPLGTDKYKALQIEYPMADEGAFRAEDYREANLRAAERLRSFGVPAENGTANLTKQMNL